MKKQASKKVVVAMSGGVDSSVAAALLKRDGFDVTGVFMKFWKAPSDNKIGWNRCCSIAATERARKTAQQLRIPFYVLNFADEFKKRIVDYFLDEYKKGRTPNPCVVCNKEIKFGLLLEKALGMKADFIATGHYARKQESRIRNHELGISYKLIKAKDKNKDQTYFLWQLKQKQLKRVLFPVGGYTKEEVRAFSRKFGLPASKTPESQEVCFIETTTADFLKKYLKQKPGKIITENDKVVGTHQGLWFYTIGQRRGIGLSGGPYYVKEKDMKKNLLVVSKSKKDLQSKELMIKNVNWISGKAPLSSIKILAKIRYNSTLTSAVVKKEINSNRYKVVFVKAQLSIAKGQSVVIYSKNELLGGGIIC